MEFENLNEFYYDANGTASAGSYNPDTNTYDYDPQNLPDPGEEVGFRTVGVARIGIELRLPNGETKIANPDDFITKMVVENPDHTVKTISGRLCTVCGSSRYQRFMPRYYNPRGPQLSNYILPQMLVIDSSEAHRSDLRYVPIFSILSVGEIQSAETAGVIVVGPGGQYAPLSDVIESADEGATIELLSGDYTTDLTIKKSINIIAKGIATIHGKIDIGVSNEGEGASDLNVKLSGLDLTERATVTIHKPTNLTIDNCVFYNLSSEDEEPSAIRVTGDNKCFVNISNNTFRSNDNRMAHAIVVEPYITEDSTINNNRFERDVCSGHTICLFGLDRNGDIEVNKNYCEVSKNMLRVSFRGIVNGRIEVEGNSYEFTSSDTKYAGLVVVEPCGTETVDMNMLDVSISDTINQSGNTQLVYMYSAAGDMRFTTATKPKIYVDGYFADVPYIIEDDSITTG